MRIDSSSIGQALTSFLALGAGRDSAANTASVDALQHARLRGSQTFGRALLQVPATPLHVPGSTVTSRCGERTSQPHPLGVALAFYDEDLSWLGERRHNATVYCKNDHRLADWEEYREWTDLPNIGMESHTYLYHIVSHWDCLDDVTLFTQGRADDSVDRYEGVEELFERTLANPNDMILYRAPGTFKEWWGVWHFGKWKQELDAGLMRKSEHNPGDFWRWLFYGEEPPEKIRWTWSATFAVRREAIKSRPLGFYKRLLNYFEVINHRRPEEGHYMERFWLSVFASDAGRHPPMRHRRGATGA